MKTPTVGQQVKFTPSPKNPNASRPLTGEFLKKFKDHRNNVTYAMIKARNHIFCKKMSALSV